jgi:hypothetical protein
MNCFHRQCNGTCSLAENNVDEMDKEDEYDPSYDEEFMVDCECICFNENSECPCFEKDE